MKKIVLLLLCLALVVSLCACRTGVDPVQDPSSEEESLMEGSEEEATITFETPYIDLQIPAIYEGNVIITVTNEEPYTLTFKTAEDEVELYSLSFGEKKKILMGTLLLENENIVLYADFVEFSKDDEHYIEYGEYQEGVNTILQHLMKDNKFVINEIIEYDDPTTFDIPTKTVTLKYPNKWKEKVVVDVRDDIVKFSYKEEKLFDIVFEECDGYLLGTYNSTPIYVIFYSFDKSKYNEEEKKALYGMTEDVDVILQALIKDSNFIINY